jgi:hypothetical protein
MKVVIAESQFDSLFLGKKVMVHYNLHKKTFSVSYGEKEINTITVSPGNNVYIFKEKVILHADYVKLGDVEFRVRTGGRNRVRTEKQKNVHAFVVGNLLEYCEYPCDNIPNPPSNNIITYNPYKNETFVYKEGGEPIYAAKEVDMINSTNKLFVVKK